jgi:kynurenine formamidase
MRLVVCLLTLGATVVPSIRAQSPGPVSRDTFDALFREVSNAGRWGSADSLGTLNLITPQKRATAARTVRAGVTISLARPLVPGPNSNAIQPLRVEFIQPRAGDIHWFLDAPTLPMHGWAFSHLDALAHAAYRGVLYNGNSDSTIDTTAGAHRLGIDVMQAGILSRGVLVDIPWFRGVAYLDTSAVITADELSAWERRTGITVQSGDVVLIRTGRGAREQASGTWRVLTGVAGLHPDVARWLHARGIAALGSDVASEHYPSLVPGVSDPIHQLTLVAMGMPLMDNLALEDLAREAKARRQWTFLYVVAPLPVRGGSGSLINALAVF